MKEVLYGKMLRELKKIIAACAFSALFCFQGFSLSAMGKTPKPTRKYNRYSLSRGEVLDIPSRKVNLPFVLYGDDSSASTTFIPSGYIGDSDALGLSPIYDSAPTLTGAPGRTSVKITYKAKGSEGWAGVYWLSPANNWGKVKGAGFDFSKARKMTFWIRGEKGTEVVTEIKVGGVAGGAYPDSDVAGLGPLKLSTDWDQYTLDLTGKDLRHIIGGFCFVLRRADNPNGAIFYIDEIVFMGDDIVEADGVSSSTAPVNKDVLSPDGVGVVPPAEAPQKASAPAKTIIIPFQNAKSALTDDVKTELNQMVKAANSNPKSYVVVSGHTDNIGAPDINKSLSRERAKAIADYLAEQGLNSSRIAVIGYGDEKPLAPDSNATDEGLSLIHISEPTRPY